MCMSPASFAPPASLDWRPAMVLEGPTDELPQHAVEEAHDGVVAE